MTLDDLAASKQGAELRRELAQNPEKLAAALELIAQARRARSEAPVDEPDAR